VSKIEIIHYSLFALQLFAALGCGLIAGVFFAFSTFVMKALAQRPSVESIAAMQSINITIINPWFMTAFFGTGLACLTESKVETIRQTVDDVYRTESRRVFATLLRLLGDYDLSEEALHDAFTAAVTQWSQEGVPANPRSWLVSTGRFKAIDALRRRTRFDASLAALSERLESVNSLELAEDDKVEDDRLRLIFTCCHPALSPSTQVALSLREICGLKTEEIVSAFLTAPATIAQRIVRGKAKTCADG
jgi:RNA polymerase sigma-70 factor (ECF subfamily)